MRLFGILFSCVCLQLAAGPAAQAVYPEGEAVQLDPGQDTANSHVPAFLDLAGLIAMAPLPSISLLFGPILCLEKPFSLGSKEFFIRTGLSPPSFIGEHSI